MPRGARALSSLERHKLHCVYKHTAPNGKVYIGITKQQPQDRWKGGFGYVTNIVFYRAIQKYGWDNIEHEIVFDGLTYEEAKEAEVRLIAEYNATDRRYGYNVTAGGDNAISRPHTDEEKRHYSELWRGSRNPNARPVICLETLHVYETAVEARKATGASKICDCAKRAHKHRTSGGFHWAFYDQDKPMNFYEELLEKYIAEENAPKVVSERARKLASERSSIPVRCIETGEVFTSLRTAAKAHHTTSASICNCCKGRGRTAGGYHWAYYDPGKSEEHYTAILEKSKADWVNAHKRSDEYLRKISERSSKPVKCVETGSVYPSQIAAHKATGLGKSDICACCRGRQKTAGGFHWAYA